MRVVAAALPRHAAALPRHAAAPPRHAQPYMLHRCSGPAGCSTQHSTTWWSTSQQGCRSHPRWTTCASACPPVSSRR
jgi:hypothetical protein